jgi:HEAT repeat protein
MLMKSKNNLLIAGAVTVAVQSAHKADAQTVETLLVQLKSPDENVSGPAWQSAGPCGAKAVQGLGKLMADDDFEVARSAKRALMNVVWYAGRPGAEKEARAVQKELIQLLKEKQPVVRKCAVWMLSEIGNEKAVPSMATLLTEKETREDARCAILRMPREAALYALRRALKTVPDDFKYALADSLRTLGEPVAGFTSTKLVPTAKTEVEMVKPR